MRTLPAAMKQVIEDGDFTGENKAVTRVVVTPNPDPGQYQVGSQLYFSLLFRKRASYGKELPNVKSVSWERSVESDISSCTVELFNTRALPPGTGPDTGDTFDMLGYYTYNRGRTSYSQSYWGHAPNEWRNHLLPDRMVHVYQGYGVDWNLRPEDDPHMVLTGVWLIDDITYTADGLITLECRDPARLLSEQICFPPVVPLGHYPLKFDTYVPTIGILIDWNATGWKYYQQPQEPLTGLNEGPVETNKEIAAVAHDDSTWTVGQAPFGWDGAPNSDYNGFTPLNTLLSVKNEVWLRRVVRCTGHMSIRVKVDNFCYIYVNGKLLTNAHVAGRDAVNEIEKGPFRVPHEWLDPSGNQTVAVHFQDKLASFGPGDLLVADVRIEGSRMTNGEDDLATQSPTSTDSTPVPVIKEHRPTLANSSTKSTVNFGHHAADAFDTDDILTYWLSNGYAAPNSSDAFEYIQGRFQGMTLGAVKVKTRGGPYTCYLSVYTEEASGGKITGWNGIMHIPYKPGPAGDNGSRLLYSQQKTIPLNNTSMGGEYIFTFPPVKGVTNVRLTFTNLYNSGQGDKPFRVAVRDVLVYEEVAPTGGTPIAGISGSATVVQQAKGNYKDYSEIVKRLLAYGGFYWPENGIQHLTNGNTRTYSFAAGDPYLSQETPRQRLDRILQEIKNGRTFDSVRASVDLIAYGNTTQHWEPLPTAPGQDAAYLPPPYGTATDEVARGRIEAIFNNRNVPIAMPPHGRIWGDIEMAGLAGKPELPLGVEIWDKKSLLEGINYVKDILGFLFYVDEHGAAQFRSPNVFRLGNWKTDVDGLGATRTYDHITLRDDEAILGLRARLSSRNIRETVFVANNTGQVGAISKGRMTTEKVNLTGVMSTGGRQRQRALEAQPNFRRVGGWTDQNFTTSNECQIMADMITLRQLFTFRQNSIRIPANPALQIDDQVKIVERTTGDAYFHHVRSISSSWDLDEGKWTYDVSTSWLGINPVDEWAFATTGLSKVTQDYLTALGQM